MRPTASKFSLRRARAADFNTLFLIHRAAMGEYIAATWGWDEAWQLEHFRTRFKPEVRLVIEVEGATVGFLDIVKRKECLYVENIEIAPRFQGRGIGSRILRKLIAQAEATHVPVKLQVLKANPRARALYDGLGFRCIGETDTHFVMQWRESL